MDQLNLPLLTRHNGPSAVPTDYVKRCSTYRQAVRLCWQLGRITNQRALVEGARMRRQHVSDYLHRDDKPTRRSLPAQRIADFEAFVGNTLVSQWIAAQSHLTVLEEMQAARAAA
jgi:hypothetical protein